ncbi:hypothetical protein BJX70DRAFT_395232 [Aspergillus crustosus]
MSTLSTASPSPSSRTIASPACPPQLSTLPTRSPACAMFKNKSYRALMTSCCGSAAVSLHSDCNFYCIAQDQTVGELAECLIKSSQAGEVWCSSRTHNTGAGFEVAKQIMTPITGDTGEDDVIASNEKETPNIGVVSALLLALVVFGGVMPPVP